MRRILLVLLCALTLVALCGCGTAEEPSAPPQETGILTVINEVRKADIWILPDTEANRKTTVWGTAGLSQLEAGKTGTAKLPDPGESGQYLFRMIDTDGFYYSANGLTLEPGQVLRISGSDAESVTLTVEDAAGNTLRTYEVFSARL